MLLRIKESEHKKNIRFVTNHKKQRLKKEYLGQK